MDSRLIRSEVRIASGVLTVLLLASCGLAQDSAAKARTAAGCGPNQAQFDVRTNKKQHPMGQVEGGKVLVYVFADEDRVNGGLHIGGITTRVGVDGSWMGANDLKSYFFFPVDPGDHRLCTSQQSKIESRTKNAAAASFTAEAGKTYYFRTMTPDHPKLPDEVSLVAVDAAQAQLLVATSAFSTSQLKK